MRIGHRGAAAHAPDNTLAGLRKAAALIRAGVITIAVGGGGIPVVERAPGHLTGARAVIVVEHNLQMMKAADYIIDLVDEISFVNLHDVHAHQAGQELDIEVDGHLAQLRQRGHALILHHLFEHPAAQAAKVKL